MVEITVRSIEVSGFSCHTHSKLWKQFSETRYVTQGAHVLSQCPPKCRTPPDPWDTQDPFGYPEGTQDLLGASSKRSPI